eukprot:gb/GECG01006935.1/.p1 GENE.gb/GECG01006935.1/~~gb/GECG01006935.1/.p1  ORF type:complete len:108 (+),score=12.42 gb/GECG01006935.1/:1-324(+)
MDGLKCDVQYVSTGSVDHFSKFWVRQRPGETKEQYAYQGSGRARRNQQSVTDAERAMGTRVSTGQRAQNVSGKLLSYGAGGGVHPDISGKRERGEEYTGLPRTKMPR